MQSMLALQALFVLTWIVEARSAYLLSQGISFTNVLHRCRPFEHSLLPTSNACTNFNVYERTRLKNRPTKNAQYTTLKLWGTSANKEIDPKENKKGIKFTKTPSWSSIGIGAWFVAISYFMVQNYKVAPWPKWVIYLFSKKIWVLIHAISSMLFSGGIIISTIIEWVAIQSKKPDVISFWFSSGGVVSNIDKSVVLPALTISIISGMAQAAQDYGSMALAPKYIRSALHLLATFALWWGFTDLTTQQEANQAVLEWTTTKTQDDNLQEDFPKVLTLRRLSNVVSIIFVGLLYALMAIKPWSP